MEFNSSQENIECQENPECKENHHRIENQHRIDMLSGVSSAAAVPFSVEVVLFEPEIPQNTGNIARTCAALGCPLHLVGPLGFRLTDRYLKRAGIDYWHLVEVDRYPDLETFFDTHTDGQYFFLSTKAKVSYDKANFKGKMYLVFGKESAGLPSFVFERYPHNIFRVPMRPGVRSLNLASTASLVMYEAFRQNGFYGVETL